MTEPKGQESQHKPVWQMTPEEAAEFRAEVVAAAERAAASAESEPAARPVARRGKSRYPWSEWMDGDWHEVQRGVDFDQPAESFRSYLYNYAARHDMQVMTQIVSRKEDILAFCFIDQAPGT